MVVLLVAVLVAAETAVVVEVMVVAAETAIVVVHV